MRTKRHYARGRRIEWRVRDDLRERGYMVIRSAGSRGPIDLIACRGDDVIAVQCKSSRASARAALRDLSEMQQRSIIPRTWRVHVAYIERSGNKSSIVYVPPLATLTCSN